MRQKKISFKDFIGSQSALEPLRLIIDYLREPQKHQKLGAKICEAILIVGPSGSGKTHLARAVAGEANVPFFYVSGTEFPGVVYVHIDVARIPHSTADHGVGHRAHGSVVYLVGE